MRIILAVGPAQSIELLHPPGKSGVRVRRRTLVETSIRDGDDLPFSFLTRRRRAVWNPQDLPGHRIVELRSEHLLHVADLVQGSDVREPPGLRNQANLLSRDPHLIERNV